MGCRVRGLLKEKGSWKEGRDAPKQQEDMHSSASQAQGATRAETACTHPLSGGVGPRVCSLESAGEGGRENRGGQLE